ILIGEATKLTPYLVDLDKEYLATVRLGVVTDTQDLGGAIVDTRPAPELGPGETETALRRFVGVIRQVPPMGSAVRAGGKRLYELAREGRTVERSARDVVVHAIELEAFALPDITLRVRCGKGTYVRVLAADLGDALGCGATLAALARTRVGPYALDAAVTWAEVRDARHAAALWPRVQPLDSALASLPAVRLDAASAPAFAHGQAAEVRADAAGPVRVYGSDDTLLGIGIAHGGAVRPERLFHADPPRPSVLPA